MGKKSTTMKMSVGLALPATVTLHPKGDGDGVEGGMKPPPAYTTPSLSLSPLVTVLGYNFYLVYGKGCHIKVSNK